MRLCVYPCDNFPVNYDCIRWNSIKSSADALTVEMHNEKLLAKWHSCREMFSSYVETESQHDAAEQSKFSLWSKVILC